MTTLQKLLGRSQVYNLFFGTRAPEPGTIFLVQKRIYILPTRPGLAFCSALIVLLIGSINYNLSLGYMLTFLLASMGMVAILHTFRNLVHLHITPGRVEPVFAGDTAWFQLFLENRSGYDRHAVTLWQSGRGTSCDVPSRSGTAVSLPVPAEKRGWLAPGRITLDTRFPIGLLRAWSYITPDMRCIVFPKPDDTRLPLPEPAEGRGEKRVAGGGTDDFAGLRNYQPSDSPRHIHWKAAAHAQQLLTKVFSGRAAAELMLDWNLLPNDLDVEARLSRLARWVISADEQGLRYGLRLPGLQLAADHGESHRFACLKALALHGLQE